MTSEYKPDAITLDICLPDIDGWRVMDRLKNDMTTRHIPVCIISTEDVHDRAQSYGVLSVLTKPFKSKDTLEQLLDAIHDYIGEPVKNLALLGDALARDRIVEFIGSDEFRVTPVATGGAALELLNRSRVDCLIVNSAPPDMTTEALLKAAGRDDAMTTLPVILYSEQPPSTDLLPLRSGSSAVTFRQVCSPERLLDQTAFFLHAPVAKLPEPKRRILEQLYQTDDVLAGKKVLIVDDDIRNIFALTSILEWRNMVTVSAETGRDAINILQAERDVDVVLMDIMMPEMDGLDTMRVIRKLPQFNRLPIIALTAKAMKDDREKCIEAGAWDYLSKPVDTEQLLSVLRVWLHR
jgi:CheY-like chemotaxis protein